MSHAKRNKPHPLLDLGYDLDDRRNFALEALGEVGRLKSAEAIVVGIYKPDLTGGLSPECTALKLLCERFQMTLQRDRTCGLVVCDEEQKAQGAMRDVVDAGSFFFNFTRIQETMMFVPSHLSPGVQLADFVCGAAARSWNWKDDTYLKVVAPYLRRYRGSWRGAGLKSYPGDRYPGL
jgi:hypothetical protein